MRYKGIMENLLKAATRLLRSAARRKPPIAPRSGLAGSLAIPAAARARTIRGSAIEVLGRRFPNPLGLAAGFDKDAEVPDAMAQARLRLCRMRHRHAAPAGRQSAPASVPPRRRSRRHQPHGLQQ